VKNDYDMDAIKDRLLQFKERYPSTVPGFHGGEPTLMKTEDMQELLEFINTHWDGSPHIQTHGGNLDSEMIDLLDEYNVSVGISIDGPQELNDERVVRNAADESMTRAETRRTCNAIWRLLERDMSVGIIVVLHETNAGTDERLERLLDWMDLLCRDGAGGHYNPAISYEGIDGDVSLSEDRLAEVFERTWEWMCEEEYRVWGPFDDYLDNLLGVQRGNCVQNTCDIYNPGAAKIIRGDGETTGCGKAWSTTGDGVVQLSGPSSGNKYNDDDTRYEMLKQVPGPYTEGEPDLGGCKGCPYWEVCMGGCPAAGEGDDWRERTQRCQTVRRTYEAIEDHLRGTMPSIRLVTDTAWDSGVGELAMRRQADIKPFGAMRPGTADAPSATSPRGVAVGSPADEAGVDAPESEQPPARADYDDPDAYKQALQEHYDTPHVTVDDEGNVHADSAMDEIHQGEESIDADEDPRAALERAGGAE